jgi:hypothetical protein
MSNYLIIKKFPVNFRLKVTLFDLLIIIAVWGPIMQMLMLLFKYSGLPYFDAADVMKFSVAVILILVLALNFSIKKIGFNYLYPIIFLPILVGLVNLQNLAGSHEYKFFIIHAAGSILIFSLVNVFSMSHTYSLAKLIKEINRSAVVALLITVFYLAIYSSLAISDYLYFGPSTGVMLVLFPWFVMRKNMKLALLCFAVVIVGGKRAVMVALFFEIFLLSWFFGREFWRQFFSCVFKMAPLILIILFASLFFLSDYSYQRFADFWDLSSGRILGSFEGFIDDPNKISSGRFAEIDESLNIFLNTPFSIFFGFGFGWSFYWIEEPLHFLHFSPINFLFQYGLIIFIFLTVVFLIQIYLLFNYFKKSKNVMFGILFVIFLGQIVEGFFSYMYVVNPLMWCILGLLIAMRKRQFSMMN